MTERFYKTTFSIDVYSELPHSFSDLSEIHRAITDGPCIGSNLRTVQTTLTPKQVADALTAAGSDPTFFNLDHDGNPIAGGTT